VDPRASAPPWSEPEGADQGLTDRVRVQAGEVAQQAQQQVQDVAGRAQGRLQEQIGSRTTQAGEAVTSTASDLRSIAEELRNRDQETPAKLAEQVAEGAERLGSYLRDADGEKLMSDFEDLARRQPWAFVAGGIALGFVVSRFVKASGDRRFRSREGEGLGAIERSRGAAWEQPPPPPAPPNAAIPGAMSPSPPTIDPPYGTTGPVPERAPIDRRYATEPLPGHPSTSTP
jgi:hypothetical protein